MSEYKNTLRKKTYHLLKVSGIIYNLLNEKIRTEKDLEKMAMKLGIKKKYLSKLLNGDMVINFTWKQIVKLCLSLDKIPVLEIKELSEITNN